MHILTARRARELRFDCKTWSNLATNATREEVISGGYLHDTYEAGFSGNFHSAADALLAYKVFAPHRMYRHVCTPDHRVALGAVIVQRIVFGPLAIEAAVRVIEVEQTAERASFSYATLQGHAERGIASFAVVRGGAENKFVAEAWSRSGHWLTVVGRPVARLLQRLITREAVKSFCAANQH